MLRAPCNEYQNAVSVGYSEIGSIRAFLTNENENVNTPYMGIWVHLFTLQEERQKINPRKTLTGVVIIQHTGNNRPKKKKKLTDIPRYAVKPNLNILKNSGEKVYVNGKWLRTGQENKLGLCGKITLSGCLETIMRTAYEFSCWEARLKIVKLKQEVIQFTLKNKSKKNI